MRLNYQDFLKRSKFGLLTKSCVFRKNIWSVFKIAKSSKFAVERDWIARVFQNSGNLGSFFHKEQMGFSKRKLKFWKNATGSKLTVDCEWINKVSQNVQKLAFVSQKIRWVFQKSSWIFSKSLKVANLPQSATEKVRLLKTFKIWFY